MTTAYPFEVQQVETMSSKYFIFILAAPSSQYGTGTTLTAQLFSAYAVSVHTTSPCGFIYLTFKGGRCYITGPASLGLTLEFATLTMPARSACARLQQVM